MADVHHLRDVSDAEREAGEWIARLNADDVSEEDRTRFTAWRDAHPTHARVFDELSSTWRRFTAAGPLVRAVSFGHSMNEAARSEVAAARAPRRRWPLAAAASVAALATLLAFLYVQRLAPETELRTAIGEHATISLPDGSTLELNSNSAAHVEYSKAARVIRLERGEAFFTVAHDVRRPFWVLAGDSWVRAVGTAFNVYLRPTGVVVTVSEGTVKVGAAEPLARGTPSDDVLANSPASVLSAGQQADLHGQATALRKLSPAELARADSWREGTVYFENEPLGEVVGELSRYTATRVIVEDERLRHMPVGGTFQASSQGTDALLTMLEQAFGVTVRREGDRVYVETASDARSK